MNLGKKIAILGAGPAGLACASVLAENGYIVEVFDENDVTGGMCRSPEIFGQKVDLGSHRFFSKDKRICDFWESALPDSEYLTVKRLSRIFYNHRFFYYPLRGWDALKNLGLMESFLCVLSYFKAQLLPYRGNNFETWVSNAFGHRLYTIFFKTYSEKLWGIPCTDLDSAFAAQRIKGFNLLEAAKTAFWGNKDEHQTLLTHFLYPKLGAGQVYDAITERLQKQGCTFHLGCRVTKILTSKHHARGIEYENLHLNTTKIRDDFDAVVSSAVFTDMVRSMDELSSASKELADKLTFRNTILIYLEVAKEQIFEDNWIYVHSPDIGTGRLSNFANWSLYAKQGRHENMICMEYWANNDDLLWNLEDSRLIEIGSKDLIKTGFVTESDIRRGAVIKLEKSYPVYKAGYMGLLKPIMQELDGFRDLYFIGRNGSFKYNNQDHSILMGLLCADKILGKYHGNLWSLNTDYAYQEQGILK